MNDSELPEFLRKLPPFTPHTEGEIQEILSNQKPLDPGQEEPDLDGPHQIGGALL